MKQNIQTHNNWLYNTGEKVLIAGPCSAETQTQVMETAKQIAADFPEAIFRSGAWKPRTRPNQFEGKGEDALQWLAEVKKTTGLRVTTEVAIPRHVEQALKYGIDIFWIGARTTVNPFMVQELAECLRGTNIPVMVKNPLHPDLQLWIGAIERFANTGLTKLAAIHRGFYTFEHSEYRNAPRWELVSELKALYPDLPIICDISHIAGTTSLLQMIAQQAVDLQLNGLMIETHCDPKNALSDSQQQVEPDELREIMSSLKYRHPYFTQEVIDTKMAGIRQKIDELDTLLLSNLSQRMDLAREIGELKKIHNVSILQLDRWKEVINQCMQKADDMGLYREFVRNIFIQIHDEAIRLQAAILTESEKAPEKID